MKKKHFIVCSLLLSVCALAQPGRDGTLTVSSPVQVLNKYCPVSANIVSGSSLAVVANPTMLALCPGDLVMVYQAQGASINPTNATVYGDITSYNSSGLYEFKYVKSVNGNSITTQTTFTNAYSVTGKTQVIRVPQYSTLTINPGSSVSAKAWKDTTIASVPYRFGGLVVIHAADIINNGTITASGSGFRGGAVFYSSGLNTGMTAFTSSLNNTGGEKGESIAGYQPDYDALGGRYCMGAPANGGGGGNGHNAGGGGGANGFNGNAWTGQGVMVVNATNLLGAWALSTGYIANGNALTTSSGGGHAGYSYGDANMNAAVQGPGNSSWVGDSRREVGGMGGRPLTSINAETRIFFGGGGGAPHADNNASGAGSNGGGIVYLIATAAISGTGMISSNGNLAGNTSGCNCDGAPGAGAGGSIILKAATITPAQLVQANGGKGGNQLFPVSPSNPNESEGPGGGGGGGFVAISATGITPQLNGGQNGTSLSNAIAGEMTSNGATEGAPGETGTVSANFISFVPITTFTASGNKPGCIGSTLGLFSASITGATYSWTGPNSFTSAVRNPTIANTSTLMAGIYTVVATFTPGCFLQSTFSVTVDKCTAIGETMNESRSLRIYPNPNNGNMTVESHSDLELMLVNATGQHIRTMSLSAVNGRRINIEGLPGGVYFITGYKGPEHIHYKIVVEE